MKYLCLIYDDEKKAATMSKEEGEQFMGEYFAFTEGIKQSGHYLGGNDQNADYIYRAIFKKK